MKNVILNETIYQLEVGYKGKDYLRVAFNRLMKDTYGFNLEDWYQASYWKEQYIPYTLFDKGEAISNVSVTPMDFSLEGIPVRALQIGAVMTAAKYRHLGLSRFLMETVLEEWMPKADFIFLYANDEVLEYYPKFCLYPACEFEHRKLMPERSPLSIRKLDMKKESQRSLFFDLVNSAIPVAKLDIKNNPELTMFYALYIYPNSIYYLEELDCAVVADYQKDTLILHAIYQKEDIPMDYLLAALGRPGIKNVRLGFTPQNTEGFMEFMYKKKDSTLFVSEKGAVLFEKMRLRIPVLTHT